MASLGGGDCCFINNYVDCISNTVVFLGMDQHICYGNICSIPIYQFKYFKSTAIFTFVCCSARVLDIECTTLLVCYISFSYVKKIEKKKRQKGRGEGCSTSIIE